MVKIVVRKTEPFEAALRRFKKYCARAGVFSEAKRAAAFEKPCDKRRRLKKQRRANMKKAQSRLGV
ncbi:MAG: 30S ribosomal protein S21 [Planctomycetes bacterium]|nr:30S ribosomal protein S21 [Planctomycetota bacterium]